MTTLTALLPLAVVAVMYWRRARTLARRGAPVPGWRQGSFALALVLASAAQLMPYEDELFFVHMLQHVVLGDLAALAFVVGLSGPLLRPILGVGPLSRLRVLAHPLVALPLWAFSLYLWHLPPLYEGAVRHDAVHALEHLSFFGTGVLMWAAVVEVLPGPEWFGTGAKFGYVAVVRLLETVLGNVFIWSGDVVYDVYARGDERFGISPLEDQGLAGMTIDVARLPIPGNAEFALYLVVLIVAWIVAWASDVLNASSWFDFFQWVTIAYILSRGIAKASRVLEQ